LEELANAKGLGAAIQSNTAYAEIEEAVAFAAEFPGKLVALQETFDDKMLQQQVRDAITSIKDAFHIATITSDTAPESQVLERLEDTRVKRDQVAGNYSLLHSARGGEVTSFLNDFDKQFADFKANYTAKVCVVGIGHKVVLVVCSE
jgi:hypothetical protein